MMSHSLKKIMIAVLAGVCIFVTACSHIKISSDINEYGYFGQINQIYSSEKILFPEDLKDASTINDYKFLYDTIGFGGYQIYLDVIYSEEKFQEEVEYWKNYEHLDGGAAGKKLKFDNSYLFNYPTYVAGYRHNRYHYMSVIEEQNRIIYILTKYAEENPLIVPEEFLPKNYFQNLERHQDSEVKRDGYYFSITSGSDNWYE